MRVWKHRIKAGSLIDEKICLAFFLRHNYISIGWSDVAKEFAINPKDYRGDIQKLSDFFQKIKKPLSSNDTKHSLCKFVCDFKINDIVMIPVFEGNNREVLFAEIIGECENYFLSNLYDFDEKAQKLISFIRKARLITKAKYSELDADLQDVCSNREVITEFTDKKDILIEFLNKKLFEIDI